MDDETLELKKTSGPHDQDKAEEEEWHWIPKIIREVTTVDETTVEVCPSLKWLNRKKKLKCKKIKRRKR